MKTHVDGTACFMYGGKYIRQPINKNIQISIPGKVKDIVYKMWWSHPDPKKRGTFSEMVDSDEEHHPLGLNNTFKFSLTLTSTYLYVYTFTSIPIVC